MKKIISLFVRDFENPSIVTPAIAPGAEWVVAGEGVATRKYDGTACLVRDGVLYKRYDAKNGKPAPAGFEPAQEPDPITGHWPGWLRVTATKPEDQYHIRAWWAWLGIDPLVGSRKNPVPLKGTYELCGPNFQANPEQLEFDQFIRHGLKTEDAPRTFEGLKAFFTAHPMEGVVWHHPDGRMVKIKSNDLGVRWGSPKAHKRAGR